jgi:3-oxoacyl-[acyl-carrier protein] reductase
VDLQLTGRRAFVTGSSSGIGRAVARRLAEEGAHVVVHGRDRARADGVAKEIGAAGVVTADLRTDEGCALAHEQAMKALGGTIEILINNAGGNSASNSTAAPLDIVPADFIDNYNANALAAIRLCRLVAPDMVQAKFGRIVNVSSAVAVQPNNLGVDYSAAKSALNNYTVSLAGSLKGVGVTANIVSPGVIMVDGLLRMAREKYGIPNGSVEEVTAHLVNDGVFILPPAGRLGTGDDLAVIICTLVSPLSGFVTGANYRVDGGQVRSLN